MAPASKRGGDATVSNVRLDYDSFRAEVASRPAAKFASWEMYEPERSAPDRVCIPLSMSGDNDRALMTREDGYWYVANPIHIIR